MNFLPIKYILFAGLLGIFFSCNDSKTEQISLDYGYEYFPLKVGQENIFRVDSTILFSGGNDIVMTTSYIREVIAEALPDDGDFKTYRIEKYTAPSQNGPWKINGVEIRKINTQEALVQAENLTFLKLVFPIEKGVKWDGNIYFDDQREITVGADKHNIYQGWEYQISDVGLTRDYDFGQLTGVIRIGHIDEEDFLDRKFSEEYYAKGIGLVESNLEIFHADNGKDDTTPWIEGASKGFTIKKVLVSHH